MGKALQPRCTRQAERADYTAPFRIRVIGSGNPIMSTSSIRQERVFTYLERQFLGTRVHPFAHIQAPHGTQSC